MTRLILFLLVAWLLWRWVRTTRPSARRPRPDDPRKTGTADAEDLSKQEITDADYEELP
jgi:hypothetical protein